MKKAILYNFLMVLITLTVSCLSKSETIKSSNNSSSSNSSSYENENDEEWSNQISENNEWNDISSNSSDCKFEDGTYSAIVYYNNSNTGYSATYTLDVEVQDCQIVQINFPNGGYLDYDHI